MREARNIMAAEMATPVLIFAPHHSSREIFCWRREPVHAAISGIC